mmetsp:Transcript_55805/g.161606  ORF Transcript_55805/g.161606 Transcript_55805/m.161606 type:complete len:269 (+) Transcript_55805:856-1662(+)
MEPVVERVVPVQLSGRMRPIPELLDRDLALIDDSCMLQRRLDQRDKLLAFEVEGIEAQRPHLGNRDNTAFWERHVHPTQLLDGPLGHSANAFCVLRRRLLIGGPFPRLGDQGERLGVTPRLEALQRFPSVPIERVADQSGDVFANLDVLGCEAAAALLVGDLEYANRAVLVQAMLNRDAQHGSDVALQPPSHAVVPRFVGGRTLGMHGATPFRNEARDALRSRDVERFALSRHAPHFLADLVNEKYGAAFRARDALHLLADGAHVFCR